MVLDLGIYQETIRLRRGGGGGEREHKNVASLHCSSFPLKNSYTHGRQKHCKAVRFLDGTIYCKEVSSRAEE